MELLLRTNFDIPKLPTSGPFDPLRYLSLKSETEQTRPEHQPLTGTAVFEVARRILEGSHAIPTRLKILLDRALNNLSEDEKRLILSSCSWNIEDYTRGYKLKDGTGNPLDRWNMCSKQEEPLVLQQFLLFKETRTITQQLIIQDLTERAYNPAPDRGFNTTPEKHKFQINDKSELRSEEKSSIKCEEGKRDSLLQMVTNHNFDQRDKREEENRTPEQDEKPIPLTSSPHSYRMHSPISAPVSISGKGSPLFPRRISNGIPLPPTSMSIPPLIPSHFPMFPFPGIPVSLPHTPHRELNKDMSGALNLSRHEKLEKEPLELESDTSSRRSSFDIDCQSKRSSMPDDIGITYVSPTTGKKRVQCNVCMKTFCDKGALKIHFSAVHLREMHKCSVPGCNMMFSSRRSRNRHSANPNPKLHTPHIRRKISPHDGRTHQGPVIPFGLTPKPPISQHHLPVQSNLPVSGVPPFHHFHSLPPNLIPPELHKFHHQQMELQRFHEMQKLSSLYSRHLAESEKVSRQSEDLESISEKLNVTDPDSRSEKSNENGEDQKIDITDDEKSLDNSSSKEEGLNGRKRKRQNPTRIQTGDKNDEETNFSSDDNDEGFPDPMDDDDEDEHQMDFESGEGGSEKSKISEKPDIPGINQTEPKPGDNEERINDVKENKTPELNGSDREEGATGKIQVRNDLTDQERIGEGEQEENQEDMGRKTPLHSDEEYDNIFDEIPIDKENPLRCVDCGREFQNHFSVKIHYQNVHLKLVHKCTIDGCNAAFPSKRSRDRHSSNLTLHRKLLSTTEMEESSLGPLVPHSGEGSSLSHLPSHTIPPYQNEFLARFFAEQQHQHQQQQQQQQQQRFPFPFLPGLHSHPSHPSAGLSHPRLPPPFGMLPFNPLFGDLSRLPGLFNKVPDPSQAKMVEENLRKYMAMANMATKIENH